VPSTSRLLIYQAGPENLPPGDNRLWWFVKPIADPPGQQWSYLPPASGMSPFFVVEQTSGIDKGWLSNSVGLTGTQRTTAVRVLRHRARWSRARAVAPKPTPTLTPAIGQVGWKADRGLQQVAYNAERETTTRDGA
jgi:hypothetical protein